MRHAGAGSRRYHILGRFHALGATLLWLLTVSTAFAGPVELKPSSDSRLVYVSAAGSDTNPGTQALPLRSLSAAYARVRDGLPDYIYLHRGETFGDSFGDWTKGGRGVAEPMVVTAYGEGAKPRLSRALFKPSNSPVRYVAFDNLTFEHPTYSGITAQGSQQAFVFLGFGGDVLIQASDFRNWTNALVFQATDPEPYITGLRVIGCRFEDLYTRDNWNGGEAAYLQRCSGFLFEDCLFDHVGQRLSGDPNEARGHALYGQDNCLPGTVRGCTFKDVGLIGGHFRGGCVIEDCVFIRCAIAVYVAYHDSVVRNNVIIFGTDASPTQPRNIGVQVFQCFNALVEGNYIGRGIGAAVNAAAITIERWPGGVPVPPGQFRATIRNNTVEDWEPGLKVMAPDAILTVSGNRWMDWCAADANGDGILNVTDFSTFINVYAGCQP